MSLFEIVLIINLITKLRFPRSELIKTDVKQHFAFITKAEYISRPFDVIPYLLENVFVIDILEYNYLRKKYSF